MPMLNTAYQSAPRRAMPILLGLMLAALSGTASAQNALGDGTALDANTGQQGRRNYQRTSLADELRFRNAIATGNAPGGLSFRGDLGYRAAGEFSGEIGSDSLFAFRRDSLYSGLAGMGIRGTDAIQYQFALTTGAAPPQNLMGDLSLYRDTYYNPSTYAQYGAGSTNPNGLSGSTIGYNQANADLDPRGKLLSAPNFTAANNGLPTGFETGSMLGTLRSSSTYATTTNLQPALLSVYAEGIDRKPIGLIASPLLGITSTPMATDEIKPENPLVARPPNAITDPTAPRGRESTRLTTSYDELVEQMRARVEALRETNDETGQSTIKRSETNDAWLVRQMQEIREQIYGTKPANDGDPSQKVDEQGNPINDPATDPNDLNTTDPNADPAHEYIPPMGNVTVDPDNPVNKAIEKSMRGVNADNRGINLYDPTSIAIDPETLEVLRGSDAAEIDQLLDPGAATRNVYSEHIAAGQRLINEGRFFDAEERFTHALSIQPRDVPAQLGRLHAQIGAGMVLSASVNLQSLFSQHPELISSRYSGKLLPGKVRIDSLIAELKERSGITKPKYTIRLIESDRVRVSAALLLSYLGYQIDDQDSVIAGLMLVKDLGTDMDRRFASLLAQIWLGADVSGTDPKSGSTPDSP
jgi:hypothetical protein